MPKVYMKEFSLITFDELVKIHRHKFVVDNITGCWIWRGSRGGYGNRYGRVSIGIDNIMRPAHRVFYEKKFGPLPQGHEPHHKCKRSLCMNPDHIEPKTRKQNVVADLKKLTTENEVQVKLLYENGKSTYAIGGMFKVDRGTITKVLKRLGVKIRGNQTDHEKEIREGRVKQ